MEFIDTHCHLFLSEFDADRSKVLLDSIQAGVHILLLPNIDKESLPSLMNLCLEFPKNCLPMAGLHPTSVDENFQEQLDSIRDQFKNIPFKAVGEIGLDLYWETKYLKQQENAFVQQIELAREFDLPIVIHCREAFTQLIDLLKIHQSDKPYKGVFHCFTGTVKEAKMAIDLGFKLGIGGVVTFKNAVLQHTVKEIPLQELILETDAPYLAPVPYRGKRNQPSYIPIIAQKIAEIKGITITEVANTTSQISKKLFNLN